jgi:flagellar hook-basal body complex protein FliE
MSQMEIANVLAQIRSLSAQIGRGGAGVAAGAAAPGAAGNAAGAPGEFARILRAGIDQVNETQQRASALADSFERGTSGVELPQVMLEMQKASVSFRALAEVRNRLISAYQDIMNMAL